MSNQFTDNIGYSKNNYSGEDPQEEGEVGGKDLRFIKEKFIEKEDINNLMNDLSEGELMVSNPASAFDVE